MQTFGDDFALDYGDIEELVRDASATKAQWEAALRHCLNRLARKLKNKTRNAMAKDLKLKSANLRPRTVARGTRQRSNGMSSSIWFGLNAVPLEFMNPRATKRGVTTRRTKTIRSAFLWKRKEKDMVFKREGEKRVMTKGRYAGKMRQPIVKQMAAIAPDAYRFLEAHVFEMPELREQFLKDFERELNWRTSR